MINVCIHEVTAIELVHKFLSNGNSRYFRIAYRQPNGTITSMVITVYGASDSLDALPKAEDFWEYDE